MLSGGDTVKIKYENLKIRRNIIIWGTGRIMERYYPMLDPTLDITAFCNSFSNKWMENFRDSLPCISKDRLTHENTVLIAIENMDDIRTVSEEMDRKGICYCHIFEAAKTYLSISDERVVRMCIRNKGIDYPEKIIKYIDCSVPYNACNLKCRYCYVRQHADFRNNELLLHSPEFIRCALSKERLGGRVLINFCGVGETLLCRELIPIVKELLEEGHYIHIVTNGTVGKAFDKILEKNLDYSHMFFKFSFHYLELKRLGLLKVFSENVMRVWNAGCSISVELVADDSVIPFIEEIKEFSKKHFGALPHCTIPRDDTVSNLDVLTEKSLDEFKKIWEQFDSDLFNYKMKILNEKRTEDCKAGLYSFFMNLESGDAWKCTNNPYLDNLYEDLNREISFKKIGHECCLPFCYNGHAWLTLGCIEELEAPTYYEMRDRKTVDGQHWISDTMRNVFSQKLYVNNKVN